MRLTVLISAIISLLLLLSIRDNDKQEQITWYNFEEGFELATKEKKPIFIDIYTNWCGWCKKMDASTFKDNEVVDFMNENFISVKLNAEQREAIAFKEKLYEYQKYGKSGYNELAVQLLDSKMSFPSFIVLSKKGAKLKRLSGYQKPSQLIAGLKKYAQ